MGNMGIMMKQIESMQRKMAKEQEEQAEMVLDASSVGAMETIKANEEKQLTNVEVNEEVVDPDDVEMLQDLIIAATNDVLKQIDEKTNATMGQFTKGLNMPGMF